MLTVVSALLLSLVGLAALWGLLGAGLHLYMVLMDRFSQSCRDSLASERLRQQAQHLQHRLQQQRQQRLGWSLVDLDGRRLSLAFDQLDAFTQRCRSELGLQAPCSSQELRRHWRRSSMRWHPDQGGDPQAWLRRLRAYEALRQLEQDSRARQLLRPPPTALPAVRPRSSWRLF